MLLWWVGRVLEADYVTAEGEGGHGSSHTSIIKHNKQQTLLNPHSWPQLNSYFPALAKSLEGKATGGESIYVLIH